MIPATKKRKELVSKKTKYMMRRQLEEHFSHRSKCDHFKANIANSNAAFTEQCTTP